MSWLRPRRAVEATPQQLAASGALGYGVGFDDPDYASMGGYRSLSGRGRRDVPDVTRERAVAFAIAAYRTNPMGKAIIDTYVAFCIGDSGLTVTSSVPAVQEVLDSFWFDPRVRIHNRQEAMLRSHLLAGETVNEMITSGGWVRRNPIDPGRVKGVKLLAGNPLWPEQLVLEPNTVGGDPVLLDVVAPSDMSGLRLGEAMYWPSFHALDTDVRGFSFLGPVLDWIDSYDKVLADLMDRTALSRYLAYEVTLDGKEESEIEDWVRQRGGRHMPRSGTIEVHNESVTWKPINAQSGVFEDKSTSQLLLTSIAAGSGLAKTWLAEPEDANRATSLTMAEPVRRRVGHVQNEWVKGYITEQLRYVVDQAVLVDRLPAKVTQAAEGGREVEVAPSETVRVSGPQIAAADAQVTAQTLHRLSLGLEKLKAEGLLPEEAMRLASRKGWEDYMGIPWREELSSPDADPDDIAMAADEAGASSPALVAVES